MVAQIPPYYVTPSTLTSDNWREAVALKKAAQVASIPEAWRLKDGEVDEGLEDVREVPRTCGIMTEKELEITELDELQELCARLASGQWSSVEVTTAYSKRAVIAHQLTNCLTEIFIDSALKRAEELDDHLRRTGKPMGPLHGCPISLKDQFDIKGVELTMGYAAYLGRISQENCCLVDLLLSLGAVLYVRTNVPQTLMLGDVYNHVFGRTHNPLNRRLSPGGSSGGEGALIAMKGSPCGVGTDIGGSVRIPSAFCGLYTIRPSSRRVPYGKATNSMLGQESILSVAGPMARTLPSVTYFLQAVLNASPASFDATCLPFPFSSEAYDDGYRKGDKLVVGLYRTDGTVRPGKAVRRALEVVKDKLEKDGHEVIEFDMVEFKRATHLAMEIFRTDGGEDFHSIRSAISEPSIPGLPLQPGEAATVYSTWQLNREKEALQQRFLSRWNETAGRSGTGRRMDALIGPAAPVVACLPGENEWPGYTAAWNLLDCPTAVIQVSEVDEVLDQPLPSEEEEEEAEGDEQEKEMRKRYREVYQRDASLIKGMPVGLQVVGQRWRDEHLLGVAQRVVEVLGRES